MGRTLKRVPLDFAHPLNKVWPGYLNNCGGPCPEESETCFGGHTAAGKWLESITRLISLIGEQAAATPEQVAWWKQNGSIYPHPYLQEWQQAPRTDVSRAIHAQIREHDDQSTRMRHLGDWLRKNPPQLLPFTSELHSFVEALAGRKVDSFCGSSVAWGIAEKLKGAVGVGENWGLCPVCEGHADDPKLRSASEAWEKTHPPEGPGFQLWETTSEGSPTSPVFATLDELCGWCADNATTFGSFKTSAEEWRKMLEADHVYHQQGNAVFM